jgi:hypothetical protein
MPRLHHSVSFLIRHSQFVTASCFIICVVWKNASFIRNNPRVNGICQNLQASIRNCLLFGFDFPQSQPEEACIVHCNKLVMFSWSYIIVQFTYLIILSSISSVTDTDKEQPQASLLSVASSADDTIPTDNPSDTGLIPSLVPQDRITSTEIRRIKWWKNVLIDVKCYNILCCHSWRN